MQEIDTHLRFLADELKTEDMANGHMDLAFCAIGSILAEANKLRSTMLAWGQTDEMLARRAAWLASDDQFA